MSSLYSSEPSEPAGAVRKFPKSEFRESQEFENHLLKYSGIANIRISQVPKMQKMAPAAGKIIIFLIICFLIHYKLQ